MKQGPRETRTYTLHGGGTRTEPIEPTDRDRIVWLLGFLQRDVAALRPGEWLDLRTDAQQYLRPVMSYPGPEPGSAPEFEDVMTALHGELLAGLTSIADNHCWTLATPLARVLVHFQQQRDNRLLPVYEPPTLADGLRSATIDLVTRWFPQLRRCKRCGAWFLPRHGRQVFHDFACASQARWAKFAPRRQRDYHAEYVKRMKRVMPGAKPERRPRARKGQ